MERSIRFVLGVFVGVLVISGGTGLAETVKPAPGSGGGCMC